MASVQQLHPDVEPESDWLSEDQQEHLHIDWPKLCGSGTFLRSWMETVTIDDIAHEYYFWLGMQALGFASRTEAMLDDYPPVKANLNICTYGPTGSGKSKANNPYVRLLREALPFDDSDMYGYPEGVSILSVPGSAEALIDSLVHEVHDPSTNAVIGQAEIMGLLKIEEFASFIARAVRSGSTMKELVIELYDVYNDSVSIRSRNSGKITVKNPFTQMLTTTQPKAIHQFIQKTDTESGFLNRWIFAAGVPRVAPIAYGGTSADLSDPVALLKDSRHWAKSGRNFRLEGRALDIWTQFFGDQIAPMRTGEVTKEGIFSRIDLTLKKLIVLFTVNEQEAEPTPAIVESAIYLYDYLATTFGMISTDLGFSENIDCQNRLLEIVDLHVAKTGNAPTRREIMRMMGKRFDTELVNRTMKTLLSMELIYELAPQQTGRGRPATRYSRSG